MSPHVKPLSHWQRKLVFGSLLLAFLLSLPVFIFYATGYRYDFSIANPTITATGGFYVLADIPDSEIYLDEEQVTNIRTFRSASYIQGIIPGLHRIHVQAPGVHTWVKELPVEPRIVTEVEAFNLPLIPNVRLIPEFYNVNNQGVLFSRSSSSPVLNYVSTTTQLMVATTTSTSTYRANQEYALLSELFAEQASSTALRLKLEKDKDTQKFGFSTTSASSTNLFPEFATTTISRDTLTLFESEGEIYVAAESQGFRQIPHYFCTPHVEESELLMEDMPPVMATVTPSLSPQSITTTCRTVIKIDRQNREVISFDFFPSNSNLVLLHLNDGVFVTEIDDRSWQNSQLLYQGEGIELLLYRGSIFIKEGELIFEVSSEIATA